MEMKEKNGKKERTKKYSQSRISNLKSSLTSWRPNPMRAKSPALPASPPAACYTPAGTIQLILVSFRRPAAAAAAGHTSGQSSAAAAMKYLAASSSLRLLCHYLFTLPLQTLPWLYRGGGGSHRAPNILWVREMFSFWLFLRPRSAKLTLYIINRVHFSLEIEFIKLEPLLSCCAI